MKLLVKVNFPNFLITGGFGCVRIGIHKQTSFTNYILFLDITRAIKQMRKDKLIKEDESLKFAEMDILKELDHPNIVKIYELY